MSLLDSLGIGSQPGQVPLWVVLAGGIPKIAGAALSAAGPGTGGGMLGAGLTGIGDTIGALSQRGLNQQAAMRMADVVNPKANYNTMSSMLAQGYNSGQDPHSVVSQVGGQMADAAAGKLPNIQTFLGKGLQSGEDVNSLLGIARLLYSPQGKKALGTVFNKNTGQFERQADKEGPMGPGIEPIAAYDAGLVGDRQAAAFANQAENQQRLFGQQAGLQQNLFGQQARLEGAREAEQNLRSDKQIAASHANVMAEIANRPHPLSPVTRSNFDSTTGHFTNVREWVDPRSGQVVNSEPLGVKLSASEQSKLADAASVINQTPQATDVAQKAQAKLNAISSNPKIQQQYLNQQFRHYQAGKGSGVSGAIGSLFAGKVDPEMADYFTTMGSLQAQTGSAVGAFRSYKLFEQLSPHVVDPKVLPQANIERLQRLSSGRLQQAISSVAGGGGGKAPAMTESNIGSTPAAPLTAKHKSLLDKHRK